MKKKIKVAVGLSGGIDSSCAAYLLKKQGYDICGFTLKLYPQDNHRYDLDSLYQARRLCAKLGIPHYPIDVTDFFKKEIIDYFIKSYLSGFTPNPCSFCNRLVKFGYLFEKIRTMGFDCLATGHYVKLSKRNGIFLLKRAKDAEKSQEYFLSLIKPHTLKHVIFPLGNYEKSKVRDICRKEKLMFQERKESQDVCFIKNRQYCNFIESNITEANKYYGKICHVGGKVLGNHKGIYYFTYGQRAGLGVSWKEPLYVLAINDKDNSIIVGEKQYLNKKSFTVNDINFFIDWSRYFPKGVPRGVKVKIRYNSKLHDCDLELRGKEIAVRLKNGVEAITPGQIAAFYRKAEIFAAGVIKKEQI